MHDVISIKMDFRCTFIQFWAMTNHDHNLNTNWIFHKFNLENIF